MVDMQYRFVDLEKTQRTSHGYADITRRTNVKGVWYVPKNPLTDAVQDWQIVLRGNFVEVPLVPYLVQPDMSRIIGFAAQLGFIVRSAFDGHAIEVVQFSIGVPCETVAVQQATMWRVYFGAAVLIG
jgi:hypothetical protein